MFTKDSLMFEGVGGEFMHDLQSATHGSELTRANHILRSKCQVGRFSSKSRLVGQSRKSIGEKDVLK